MAASAKAHAINLGMQTVGLAEFQVLANGGLSLTRYEDAELMVDPGADATRPEQLRISLDDLRGRAGMRKREEVNYCLPSQSVFTRFVKLPGSDAEEIRSIIAFEAQQNVPYPIDEVVWDYQIMGAAREGNWDIVLVAIKSDQLAEVNKSVEAAAFAPARVDVSPMALYNAFRYNYADESGVSLLIDIGSRTTNLIFIDGEKAFSRSIPIGGNTISGAIAKEFSQEVTLAEKLKKEKGFVGLGGAYAEPEDPTEARLSKIIRNTLTRLHNEIARSISFYRANQGGGQPVRAYLAGGSVSLPYMVEFFNEKLQIPIEFFNPLRNVTVGSEEVAQAVNGKVHMLGELVGLGLRGIGDCPVEINLRPSSVMRDRQLARRKPYLVAAVVCLALGLASVLAYFDRAIAVKNEVIEGVRADVSRLQGLAGQIDAAIAEKNRLQEVAAPLLLAVEERQIWTAIIDELGDRLPERFIWITQLTPLSGGRAVAFGDAKPLAVATERTGPAGPQRPGRGEGEAARNVIDAIEVRGLYLDDPAVGATVIDNYVEALAESGLFAIEDKSAIVAERSTADGERWAYGYTLIIPLKTPIALQ